MIFSETRLKGSFVVMLEKHQDDRGYFARSWCKREFESNGLNPRLVQCNISFNSMHGTMRGVHYQAEPHGEAKLVRCTAGAIYDVIIDLRPESDTFKQWYGIELSNENKLMLYVPENFAHGFLTLANNTEVFYQMSEFYHPESAKGIRWNDPTFSIQWPAEVKNISERDRDYPDFAF